MKLLITPDGIFLPWVVVNSRPTVRTQHHNIAINLSCSPPAGPSLPEASPGFVQASEDPSVGLGDHACRRIFCPVAFAWPFTLQGAHLRVAKLHLWCVNWKLSSSSSIFTGCYSNCGEGATWPMEGLPDCVASPPGLPPCSDFSKVA